jgi:uncharacterized protein (TIGR02145 family)
MEFFMKKLMFAVVVLVLAGNVWAQNAEWYGTGGGNGGKTFYISTEDDLKGLAQLVNTGFDDFSGKTIYLNADITLKDAHTPIGNNEKKFMGIFDGNGKTISGLSVSGVALAGLFGYVEEGGQIKNLTANVLRITANASGYRIYAGGLAAFYQSTNAIENCTVNIKDSIFASYPTIQWSNGSWSSSGGLVGYANGSVTIVNSRTAGKVSSTGGEYSAYSGGLVGYASNATITNSHSTDKISSYRSNHFYSGGLVGAAGTATITDSYATSDISGRHAGGLIGYGKDIKILNSYATGNVSSLGDGSSGGLIGNASNATITGSYATGKISSFGNNSSAAYAGGLVGNGWGGEIKILNSHAKGDVSGTGNYSYNGGLVARGSTVAIYDSYSEGNISSANIAGGLAGEAKTIIISDSYTKGNISATNTNAFSGGLIGKATDVSTITNSYASGTITGANKGGIMGHWKSGNNASVYFNNKAENMTAVAGLPAGLLGVGVSPENLKKQETFKNWNFEKIWAIDAKKNNGYPYLRNEGMANFGGENVHKSSFADPRDGKEYETVEISTQTWMAENLNYEAENSKCYGNEPANCQKYGRLYNWSTARTACPSDWHLPNDDEWQVLVDFAGGYEAAGEKLKAKSGWPPDYKGKNGNGTDEFGFAALPGGYSSFRRHFLDVGEKGNWWSAATGGASGNWYMDRSADMRMGRRDNDGLFSVRCVQDVDIASFKAKVKKGSFTDSRDGKGYKAVEFDNRTWMAENLNYNADGSKCYDNSESNCQKYGRLYDWNTAMKACPKGWHLPSDKEWGTLVDFAGSAIAGNILKAASGWDDYMGKSGSGADAFGFSALPGGLLGFGGSNGNFSGVGKYSRWWSATETPNAAYAWYRDMGYNSASVLRYYFDKTFLFSVRCLQD